MKHCCSDMELSAKEDNDILIDYNQETRQYYFRLYNDPEGMTVRGMSYCPWCGIKLPKSLREEWCKVIKEEFGYDSVFAEEWAKLPEKYKTEQWWRERGL